MPFWDDSDNLPSVVSCKKIRKQFVRLDQNSLLISYVQVSPGNDTFTTNQGTQMNSTRIPLGS